MFLSRGCLLPGKESTKRICTSASPSTLGFWIEVQQNQGVLDWLESKEEEEGGRRTGRIVHYCALSP